ncbi:hypothetical protein [Sideroxydans sp. CL21]|nr:hypothetical protein [Sideroxydans sp. CL21]
MPSCQIIQFPAQSKTYMPANILNLASYAITGVENTEHDYHIKLRSKGHRNAAMNVIQAAWLASVGVSSL